MVLMISLGPKTAGSNSTWPRLVARATTIFSIPSVLESALSILCTQEEQVIPSIYHRRKRGRGRKKKGEREGGGGRGREREKKRRGREREKGGKQTGKGGKGEVGGGRELTRQFICM